VLYKQESTRRNLVKLLKKCFKKHSSLEVKKGTFDCLSRILGKLLLNMNPNNKIDLISAKSLLKHIFEIKCSNQTLKSMCSHFLIFQNCLFWEDFFWDVLNKSQTEKINQVQLIADCSKKTVLLMNDYAIGQEIVDSFLLKMEKLNENEQDQKLFRHLINCLDCHNKSVHEILDSYDQKNMYKNIHFARSKKRTSIII